MIVLDGNDENLLFSYLDRILRGSLEVRVNMDVEIPRYGYSFNERERKKSGSEYKKDPLLMYFSIGGREGHYLQGIGGFDSENSRFVGLKK